MFWTSRTTARERKLQRQVAELREQMADTVAELEAERRRCRVKDVEIESLSNIIARDRERVLAESAIASRQIAEAEGKRK